MKSESTPPDYYPVYLNLTGKHCVVVGGGEVAQRKVTSLLEAGAQVTVIAPHITASMPADAAINQRTFLPDDLNGAWLVFAATDDAAVNTLISEEGERRKIWVNVVDDPAKCSMIIPAVVKRGALRIAISTGGASPTLAKQLRRELEQRYGVEYGELVELLWRVRRDNESKLNEAKISDPTRRQLWEQVLRLPLLDMIRAGEIEHAQESIKVLLHKAIMHITESTGS